MKLRRTSRLLAFVLMVAMMISLMPATLAFAEEQATTTWTKTSIDEITSEDKVAITMTYNDETTWVMEVKSGSSPAAVEVTVENDSFSVAGASDLYGWTIAETEGGYTISSGTNLLYLKASNSGVTIGTPDSSNTVGSVWNLSTDGKFLSATDSKNENRYMGVYWKNFNDGQFPSSPSWRCYKSSTASASTFNLQDQQVNFWKLSGEITPPPAEKPAAPEASVPAGEVEAGTVVTFTTATEGAQVVLSVDDGATWTASNSYTVNEAVTIKAKAVKDEVESDVVTFAYTIKSGETPSYNTIAEALAGAADTEFTVKGVVTFIDGKNVGIQDDTGAINLYLTANATGIAVGDTVIGSGKRATYKGLPQLSNATFEKSEGLTLKARETTIAALTDADLSAYITIKKLTVTAIEGNNTTVQDEAGNSLNIFKAKADPALAVGDVINFTGILSTYDGYQLRNTNTSEITPWVEAEEGLITDLSTLVDGDTIVVFNPANSKAMSETDAATYYRAGVDATVTDNKISGYDASCVWTLGVKTEDGNTTYTFTSATGRVLTAGSKNSLPMDDENPVWTIEPAATEGCVYIRNAARPTQYIEWYASKGEFSAYAYSEANEAVYAMQLYRVSAELPAVKPAAPEASVPAGEVEAGTVVTFTSATEGAVIFLSVDDGAAWTEGSTYTVNEAVTIKAKAVKDEVESDVVTFAYTIKSGETPAYNTIAEALAGAADTEFTVKGVVTFIDGKNVGIQDDTGAINLYLTANASGIAVGDTVIGSGKRATYKGLPQLSSASFEKSEGLTLKARETTLGALTDADLSAYITIKKLTVTAIEGNNTTVQDEAGNSIKIFKAKADPALAVGDVINFTGILSTYDGYQLRNTNTSEITPWVEAKEGFVTDLADLTDGAKVVIVNKANKVALSQTYSGYNCSGVGVTVTDGKLSGYGATEIWTVGVNADGSYTFSTAEGKKLSMGASYSSMPLDDVNPNWIVTAVEGHEDGFFIDNTGRTNYRIEWYADNNYWSAYNKNNTGDLFIQQFYLVGDEIPSGDTGVLPNEGDIVVVYNAEAQGVLGIDNSGLNASLSNIAATVEDGKASTENGAYAFTVGVENGYYTFQAGGKYLATNDDEALYMTDALSDTGECCTYWELEEKGDGYLIKSKTARYKGSGVVCIEFFGGAFSGWTFKAADQAIFIFHFYPLAEDMNTMEGVVNNPKVVFTSDDTVIKNGTYLGAFTIDDLRDVSVISEVKLMVNNEEFTGLVREGKSCSFTLDENYTGNAETLTCTVFVTYTDGAIVKSDDFVITVKDEPLFTELQPEPNSETLDEKCPLISVKVQNITEDTTFEMKVNKVVVDAQMAEGVISYQPAEPMEDGRTSVQVTVTRPDGVTGTKTWTFTVGEATEQLYFGQLHSHTAQYSDGAGSLADALQYVLDLPESANVQFVAFTDHSNYFDASGAANPEGALYDMSLATAQAQEKWTAYRSEVADFNESQSNVIALAGFEMTWSGGPGHINTFNSPGIVSRNNTTLNNKSDDAGMKAYYSLLSQAEGADTISQFNHPGKTFGNFVDFSYWNAVADSRIFLLEVGNGEGQIGSGGYFPSYEQYTMALDKGWHVAPTNNQDNHKGRWGNANDARDVILTDDFSEQGIYNALRAMRVYATEDKNLEIYYYVNGLPLGSSITEVPEQLEINVSVNDPDSSDLISKVEVVVNSGKTIYTWSDPAELASGVLNVTLAPDYSYYFIRVTEADGDLAVTAPVWVGETLKLGVSALSCGTAMPVTDEELTLTLSLFNSESAEAQVKSVIYTVDGSVVIGTDTNGYTVPASGTLDIPFKYTPTEGRIMTVTATVVLEQNDKEYTFSRDITLDVQKADNLVYVGIDASHYNEYVSGNYQDSMGNFAELAASYAVRIVYLSTSEELIAACGNEKYAALILTAPSRRLAAAQQDPRTYSADEIAAIQAFNAAGGTVIVAGWSDYYENYAAITGNAEIKHMAETQNELLEALGSNIRLGDDAVLDDTNNGGQSPRLYFSTYNLDHFLMQGVEYDPAHPNNNLYTELYSNYGGCSVFFTGDTVPATVTPVVYGHATTYISNSDNDSRPQGVKYPYAEGDNRVVVLATEQLEGKGLIIVSGAAFMSNFEVKVQIQDTAAEKNYSNYKICENLLSSMNQMPITPIAEVQKQTGIGYKYTIQGVVTSNASGYDKDTAFFDCIYVQDETAGICCFPVAGNYKIGDVVQITGYTDFYQAEMELQVMSIKKIGETDPVEPTVATAAQINDKSLLGSLVTLNGTVEEVGYENGMIQTIMVRDEKGDLARVFIDGYITTANEVQKCVVGAYISVTGLSSYDDTFNAPDGPFPRIRVRNRADVVCHMLPDGYYLVSAANDWAPAADLMFDVNPANTAEFMLRTFLDVGAEIKVAHVTNDEVDIWYPDGLHNHYTVDEAHSKLVNIYFKPGYDNAWSAFGGYFFIETKPFATVIGKSLTLDGKIGVNFYLELPDVVLSDPDAYVTINGVKYLVSEAEVSPVRGDTGYRFTALVKFAQLKDEQILRIFSGNDVPVGLVDLDCNDLTDIGFKYMAQDYIDYIRSTTEEDDALRKVVEALSDVGSLAQAQFNYNVEAREEINNDLSTVTADMVQDYNLTLTATGAEKLSYYGSSLLLQDVTTVRHYFKLNGDAIDKYTFTVDGVEVTPVKKGIYYYIDISNIVAKDLDKSFHVEVSTAENGVVVSLDYSAMTYAYRQLSTGKESVLIDLVKALVLYNAAADAYFP